MRYQYFYFLLLLLLCIASCKESNKKDSSKEPVIIGKELIVPKDIILYKPFNDYHLDSVGIANAKFKIYSFVDVSCSTCIFDIKKWQKLNESLIDLKVPIILICQAEDRFELLKYLCEQGDVNRFGYPFFLDTKNEFFVKNSFLNKGQKLNTILTDYDNKIILTGNPTSSKTIAQKYLDIMNN